MGALPLIFFLSMGFGNPQVRSPCGTLPPWIMDFFTEVKNEHTQLPSSGPKSYELTRERERKTEDINENIYKATN